MLPSPIIFPASRAGMALAVPLRFAYYSIFLLLLLAPLRGFGQDIEQLAKADPLVLTGGLRLGTQFYNVSGIEARAAPFQFTGSGRLNLAVYGQFNIPISFAVGRQRPDVRYPIYRQFGISPRYKWITVHAGHRNLRLSNYSLNNHTFLGGGVELNPGKLRLAAMSGRLRQGLREVSEDIDLFFGQPVYDRYAHGGRLGYGTTDSHLDLVYFRAEDREASVILPDSLDRPAQAENVVVGLEYAQRIGERFNMRLEATASGYNRNRFSTELPVDSLPAAPLVERLFTPRLSTQVGLAFKGAANYRVGGFTAGVDYERIDPGFQSMGTYFLNGDWENARATLGFGLFRQKLRLQGSLGRQRNNLYGQRAETSRRTIGSATALLNGGPRWTLTANYANFTQDHRPSAVVVLNDTLRIAATTTNYGGNWTWSSAAGEGRSQSTFTAAVNVQHTGNDNPLSESFDDLQTLFGSLNYSLRLGNKSTTFIIGANYSQVEVMQRLTAGQGLTLGWRQQLLDRKLMFSLTDTYNRNTVDGTFDGYVNALRGQASWQVTKLHSLSLGLSWIKRASLAGFAFDEQRASLTYGLTFPTLGKRKPTTEP